MTIRASEAEIEAAAGYEALFVPAVFGAWTQYMLQAAGITAGDHVLDIGCGTGVLARAAKQRVGEAGAVTGLDPAPGMLAVAARTAPDITWVQGGAEALALPDHAFTRITSQFSMMFVPDREAASREMARVLAPGGKVAMAVWDTTANNPAYDTLGKLLDREVGAAAGDALRLPYGLGDVSHLTDPLEAAGFQNLRVQTKTEQARFPDLDTMVKADLHGWLPLFGIHLDDATTARVLRAAQSDLGGFVQPDGTMVFPTQAHIVSAQL